MGYWSIASYRAYTDTVEFPGNGRNESSSRTQLVTETKRESKRLADIGKEVGEILAFFNPQRCLSVLALLIFLADCIPGHAQCGGDSYGGSASRYAIEQAMFSGSTQDVVNAINAAKEIRGNKVGCPETAYTYSAPSFLVPSLTEITGVWESVHAPGLAAYAIGCPEVGRIWASRALGGYYARLAGYPADLTALEQIARMVEAQQYTAQHAPLPLVAQAGVFGFVHLPSSNLCYLAGGVGSSVEQVCNAAPELCLSYTNGLFAGQQFLVADTKPSVGFLDGGMAFDHGWSGVFLLETARSHTNTALRQLCHNAARLAGDWSVAEPPVRNHNYTAKLIWLLAQLYDWTGEPAYRTALLDKLNRNLLPGVLMDFNQDGRVDGMTNQPFSTLTNAVAQRPGRMWDGHNASPVYHAMNAWALVEAYVALRDRGDAAEATAVKPYAVAMLDNLAWEVNNLGVGTGLGLSQSPFAFLLGLWKIAAYENEPRSEWEKAAWALWNTGVVNSFGDNTVNAGLYLLYRSGTLYTPLAPLSPTIMVTGIAAEVSASNVVALTWTGASPDWLFTVESTDSLSSSIWQAVAPTNQWPIAETHWSGGGSNLTQRFYRVKARLAWLTN